MPLAPGLTLRYVPGTLLSSAEEQAVLELLERAYNGGPAWFGLPVAPLDHLRWKYRDFPGAADVGLIEQSDRLVGMWGDMRHWFRLHGRRVLVEGGGDLALEPALQGRGVFSVVARYWRANPKPGLGFDLGVATHPASLHEIELNLRIAGDAMQWLFLPLHVGELVAAGLDDASRGPSRTYQTLAPRRVRPRWGRRIAWELRKLRAGLSRSAGAEPPAALRISTVERFDDRFRSFFEEAAKPFALIQERSPAYLSWRYLDSRGGPFVVRAAEQGDRVLAFAAVRTLNRRADLADLIALPGRRDVARALLDDVVVLADRSGCGAVRARVSRRDHELLSLLRARGFIPRGSAGTSVYSPGEVERNELLGLQHPDARVHLMLGDTDHI